MTFAEKTAPGLPANIATAATVPCARKRVIHSMPRHPRWPRSRCRASHVLRLKLVQKLPEGHFSCPTGPRHRGKKDQTLFPATYLRILQRILHIRRWWLIAPHLLPPAISCLLTSLSTAAVQPM